MGIHVLIADDSMLIRQVVKKVLKQVGIPTDSVMEANDGQEALELIKTQPVDLVLSDINMPNMDGLQMLMHIRQMEASNLQNLPVIMVSTEGSEETMAEAMELGANGYVLKPFTPEALAGQLRPLGLMDAEEEGMDSFDEDDPTAF